MSWNDVPRGGPIRGSVLAIATLTLLLLVAPMASAAQHGASGDNATTPPSSAVPTSGCPDDLSSARADDAFQQAGASAPDAATQTEVTCSGGIVLTATAAKPLTPGESYVVFFTLHDADSGEIIDAPFIQVNLSGAAAPGDGITPEVAASVDGTDGLHAVAVRPPATGQATLTVRLPRDLTVLETSFDVTGGDAGPTDDSLGANIPGFGALAVVAGLVVVALILRRRPPKLMPVALAATLVAGPAMAHAGGGAHDEGDPVAVEFIPNPSGLSMSIDGLTVSASSKVDQPETSFDLGDLSTAPGPSVDHTYPEPGAYLVQLVAYDPATLTGGVYDDLAEVGDAANQNQPPSPVVTASTRWTTYGGNVTLSAGEAVAGDGDNHAFIWAVGRSAVDADDYTYTVEAVTDGPEWNWTAPGGDADVRFEVFAIDGRRGIANASTRVRVTEELPSETETFGPFEGTLDCPDDTDDTPLGGQCTSTATHPFTMAYDGTVNATLTFTTASGQEPQNGVPDVDIGIGQAEATGTGSPDHLETDADEGERELVVWLADGVDASYSVSIEAQYDLNPFE